LFINKLQYVPAAGLRLGGVTAIAVAALMVPTSATAAAACRIDTLPVPAGTISSNVIAGDSTGRYLVGSALVATDEGSTSGPLLWVNGRLTDLPIPYPQSALIDVNAAGTITGRARGDGSVSAFRYQNGRFVTLAGLSPGDDTIPVALNNRGDVLGYSVTPRPDGTGDSHIVVWPANRPNSPRELVAPVGLNAIDIDDDGTVLGSAFNAQAATYLWAPDGTIRQVRGPSGGTDVLAVAIRDRWIAGTDNYTTDSAAVAWRPSGGPVNVVPLDPAFPSTVNGHGDIALPGAIDRRHSGLITLPDLGGPSGVTVLSDRGPAAGFASDGSRQHAVVWHGC